MISAVFIPGVISLSVTKVFGLNAAAVSSVSSDAAGPSPPYSPPPAMSTIFFTIFFCPPELVKREERDRSPLLRLMLPTAGLLRSRSWRLIGAKVTSSRCLQQRRAGAPVGAEGEHLAAAGIGCEAWSACHASAADGVQGAPREGKSASQHVKHRGRSITNSKGVLRRSPTGRLPEERPAPKGRLPLTRDVAATMERGRRDRERRSRSKTHEDAEGGKPLIPHAILGIIGANALVYLCWQETSFRRFMVATLVCPSVNPRRPGASTPSRCNKPIHTDHEACCMILGQELRRLVCWRPERRATTHAGHKHLFSL